MAIFLIATGPGLALLSQLTKWHVDRKQASLKPKVEINPMPRDNVTRSYSPDDFETFKARNRGDISKLQGPRHWPGYPPIS